MNNRAKTVAEDGMILILAFDGEATVAAFFPAVKLGLPEVPAARALQEVAADGGDVAYLRSGGMTRSISERPVAAADDSIRVQFGERHQRPDAKTLFRVLAHAVQSLNGKNVNETRGSIQAFLETVNQIYPARFDCCRAIELRDGFVN